MERDTWIHGTVSCFKWRTRDEWIREIFLPSIFNEYITLNKCVIIFFYLIIHKIDAYVFVLRHFTFITK